MPTDHDFSDLYEDGATVTLSDTLRVRMVIEPDQDATLEDYGDCYGAFAPDSRQRPDGFNGAAYRLGYGPSYDRVWWQPPTDVPAEEIETLRSHVCSLLSYGFSYVGVVLEELLTDHQQGEHWTEVTAQFLGGVDSDDPAYLNEIARDLATDITDHL